MTEYTHRVHRAATLMSTTAHVLYDEWPTVEGEEVVRKMARTLGKLLNALVDGDPPKQEKRLAELDEFLRAVPNGDTTEGAT